MADHLQLLERPSPLMTDSRPPAQIPITVISSGAQPATHIEAQRILAGTSHHGRHEIATSSTHWVQFDEPDLIVNIVKELVELQSCTG
jgi:pimeloyl-ACP methyl ester carboxylesterase